jgi:hypothetical protein
VIPRESRPRAYAGVELLLELMHILREATQLDHDSIIIACVVNHATMRPLLTGPGAPLDLIDAANPPDGVRGSISRSSVADITGIPRETVRRKINHLIEIGMLVEAAPGHVRPVAALANPVWRGWLTMASQRSSDSTGSLHNLAAKSPAITKERRRPDSWTRARFDRSRSGLAPHPC